MRRLTQSMWRTSHYTASSNNKMLTLTLVSVYYINISAQKLM